MNPLTIGSHAIRRDGDLWCITDMWRAAGAPKGHRPVDYLRTAEFRTFAEFIATSADVLNSHVCKTRKIQGGGETWTHWQLAMAYAKWISHPFHASVNDVYRAYTAGEIVGRDPEAIRLTLRMNALAAADYESAWDSELKLELARLRKVFGWTPGPGNGSEPRALAFAYGKTWRIILGDSVYDELKRRNPHPREGSLHGQWVQEQRLLLIRREDMVVTMFIARRATRWAEYEREMRSHFRRAPVQLRLVTS
jgi:hypothetical protein